MQVVCMVAVKHFVPINVTERVRKYNIIQKPSMETCNAQKSLNLPEDLVSTLDSSLLGKHTLYQTLFNFA